MKKGSPKARTFFCGQCYTEFYGKDEKGNNEMLRAHVYEQPCKGYDMSTPETVLRASIPVEPVESLNYIVTHSPSIPCDDFVLVGAKNECGTCGHGMASHKWKYNRCRMHVGGNAGFCRTCGKSQEMHDALPLKLSKFFGNKSEDWA